MQYASSRWILNVDYRQLLQYLTFSNINLRIFLSEHHIYPLRFCDCNLIFYESYNPFSSHLSIRIANMFSVPINFEEISFNLINFWRVIVGVGSRLVKQFVADHHKWIPTDFAILKIDLRWFLSEGTLPTADTQTTSCDLNVDRIVPLFEYWIMLIYTGFKTLLQLQVKLIAFFFPYLGLESPKTRVIGESN